MIKNCVICEKEFDALRNIKTCSPECWTRRRKEHWRKCSARRRVENKDSVLQSKSKYYAKDKNKVMLKEYRRRYYIQNKDQILLKAARYHEENRYRINYRKRMYNSNCCKQRLEYYRLYNSAISRARLLTEMEKFNA